MLKTIIHNKAKESGSRVLFSTNEDSLTGSVFQLLMYLPEQMLWSIINDAVDLQLPTNPGKLESIDYWPSWKATNTSNSTRVEPDVFLSFEKLDLIVEAKRSDNNSGGANAQSAQQWKDQLQAYQNEYGANDKEVRLWALGGIKNFNTQTVKVEEINKEFLILKSTWTKLLIAIQSQNDLFSNQNKESSANGIPAIFEDLITSFAFHGFFVGHWFEDIKSVKYKVNPKSIWSLNQMMKF